MFHGPGRWSTSKGGGGAPPPTLDNFTPMHATCEMNYILHDSTAFVVLSIPNGVSYWLYHIGIGNNGSWKIPGNHSFNVVSFLKIQWQNDCMMHWKWVGNRNEQVRYFCWCANARAGSCQVCNASNWALSLCVWISEDCIFLQTFLCHVKLTNITLV